MRLPIELQSLVDIYDQSFVVIDPNHLVVLVNKAFKDAYRVKGNEVVGRPCYAVIPPKDQPCPCAPKGERCPFAEVFQRAVSRVSTHTHRDAEGHDHFVRIQGFPLRTEGAGIYLGAVIQTDVVHHPDTDPEACPGVRMVGQSSTFKESVRQLMLAAKTDAPVLLQGETGTGKEMAAAYVHRHSARCNGPFYTLDCTALTEALFESEVFGHERGAFTGSVGEKRGLFELADKGTLFLDEIGELSAPLQAKLLRVLESGEFRRVGGVKTRRANVRIVCATNRDLLGTKWFRSDLYYRIACVTIRLPSLRERPSDIPQLARELLKRIGRSAGQRFSIDDDALRLLQTHEYPGNVRELRNILWVAAVNSPDRHVSAELIETALPDRSPVYPRTDGGVQERAQGDRGTGAANTSVEGPQRRRPRRWEHEVLVQVLSRHSGNRRAVAEELGVSERTIYRKLQEFGLS